MRVRAIIACALTGALVAASAAAQDVTKPKRADQRIKISKGDVVLPPRVDTLFITRFDTVYAVRTDTVRVPYQVLKVDTLVVQQGIAAPVALLKGPLYAGIFGGATVPSGQIDRLYTNGMHLGGVLGFERNAAFLGGRFTTSFTQLNREIGRSGALVGSKTPLMFSIGGDLKVIPMRFERTRFYGIGGVNYNFYHGIATVADANHGVYVADGKGGWYEAATDSKWLDRFGYSFGAGSDFRVAGQEMFIEARAAAIRSNGANSWFVPVSFGLRYF